MNISILVRILVILLLGIAGFYVATQTYFWLVSLWLFGFMLLAIHNLSRYINRTRRQMADFLLAVSQDDYSSRISDRNSRDSLDYAFTALNEKMIQLRQNRASNAQFLEAVIEQVGIALLGYETNTGKITVMNQAAKVLFDEPFVNDIEKFENVELTESIKSIRSGENPLLKLQVSGQLYQLSVTARELVLEDVPYKLVSFQNIQAELEAQEVESWQKLIRVLTHEIKNSAIPISTLSEVIRSLIIDEENNVRDLTALPVEDREDLRLGLETVGRRSQSLVSFVNAYGELAKLPEPKVEIVNVKSLITSILKLLQSDLTTHHITIETQIPDDLQMKADPTQIEQVLINLIKNAREAMMEVQQRSLLIEAEIKQGRTSIRVSDTGPGMDTNTLEKIFIPFYTTKTTGSGIGLSLGRQILRAHKGELRVNSALHEGTTFELML